MCKNRSKFLGALSLIAAALISGCNSDAVPSAYQGSFSGKSSHGLPIKMSLDANSATFFADGVTTQLKNAFTGVDTAIQAALTSAPGVYVLPQLTEQDGETPVSPWDARYYLSVGHYQNGTIDSDRYVDVYLVVPFSERAFFAHSDGASGGINHFGAQMAHFVLDAKKVDQVTSLDVDYVEAGTVTSGYFSSTSAKADVLGFSPSDLNQVETVTLEASAF